MRYPPISALRAFESAARHLNYTRAAEELHVTQSAISHQIKHIEELWGFKLFERQGRGIALTEQARLVNPLISHFFTELNKVVSLIQGSVPDEGYLRVALSQSFALKWMVTRLGNFSQLHPEIDITIITMPQANELQLSDADIAVFYSDGTHPDYHVIPLLHGYSFPVCSLRFYEDEITTVKQPSDLLQLPILRRLNVDAAPRWKDWFNAAGVTEYTLPKGLHFPNSSMALQAAIDGQGVALARSSHVADDLKAGRLVKLLDTHVQGNSCYNLIIPDDKIDQDAVKHFIAWIKDEAAISQVLFDQQAKDKGLTK